MITSAPTFRNVIFAGGGSRCFWQLGFWDGLVSQGIPLQDTVEAVGSTSAGCAMATAAILGRTTEALTLFKEMSDRNPGNVHWGNLFVPGAPLLPHARMYRGALETFIRESDLVRIRQKTVRFLMTAYPRLLPGAFGALLGFAVYATEKRMRDPIHPEWGRLAGFVPVVGEAGRCETVAEFIDMALAASCVPPVLPGGMYAGRAVLDGGLVDNVPLLLVADQPGNTLVLLSKRYSKPLPQKANVTYVQPSAPIAIDKFDYANPQGLQDAYDLGRQDGERFAENRSASLRA